ncbi:hypothetical protein ACJZ2D_007829 [Fusarium nematophilum]
MPAQQQPLEALLGISGRRKSVRQQLDSASIKAGPGRTTLEDLPTGVVQTYWVCSKCDANGKSSLFVATNTTSPIEHLRKSHMITRSSRASRDADDDSDCVDFCPPSKRPCLEPPIAKSNVVKAKELTIGWIVTADLPFTAPSNPRAS